MPFAQTYLGGRGFQRVDFRVYAPMFALWLWIGSGASLLYAVPAVPNESVVVGEVLERNLIDSSALGIEPQQTLLLLKVRILKVEGVTGKENFLQGQEGKTIEAYSKEVDSVVEGNSIKARLTFRGDERMGRYWMIGSPEFKSK